MSSAYLSLIGLYNYDSTIFDGLHVPSGIDKETLINTILLTGGEYECLYPNTSFLKSAIDSWYKAHEHIITRWLEVYNKEFEPLENYDRIEEWTDTNSGSSTHTDSSQNNGNTKSNETNIAQGNSNSTNTISAYNSNTMLNDEGSNDSHNAQTVGSGDVTTSSTGSNNASDTNQNTGHHTGRVHGNIGVTTSAKMYEEFWVLMQKYGNIYDSIAIMFLQDFIIPI